MKKVTNMRSAAGNAVAVISMLFLFVVMTGCERTVWQTRSADEIEALNEQIAPFPDSLLLIPEFDGTHILPVVWFSYGHFTEMWEFIIFNNGDVSFNGKIIRNMSRIEISNAVYELNRKGLFGVTKRGIFYKLAGPRHVSIFKLLLPQPSRPLVPGPVIDGGVFTIQINVENLDYYISFYAIDYYVENFSMCKDVVILNDCCGYLHRLFWQGRNN
jgi:hypothetical protein